MDVPLVVILGAGASRGSADYARRLCPPLTIDLFDETLYEEQLRLYDLAHQAGRFITHERSGDSTLSLERALHDLSVSEFPHHRHLALAVPPYLQHLLYAVSEAHYTDAFRYDRLIERLLRLPYVCFMTLNYDLLLDRRLNAHHQLTTFDDYISTDKNWSLMKLHGSVNWFHPAASEFDAFAPPSDLQWFGSDFECERPDAPLEMIRGGAGFSTTRYPALAMPEGPSDRLVMPPRHTWFIQSRLGSASEIDLLTIGYSGLDKEILNLLASFEGKVRRMTVVNQNYLEAVRVYERFREAGINPVWPDIPNQDFAAWTDKGGLNRLVEEYGGPYST